MNKVFILAKKYFWQLLAFFLVLGLFLQDRLIIKKVIWNGSFIEYQSFAIYPLSVLILGCFLGLVIYRILKKKRFYFGPKWFLVLSGLIGIVILITGLWGLNREVSLFFLTKFILGFLLYLVVLNLGVSFRFWQLSLIGFIVLEGLIGIGQMIFQRDLNLTLIVGEPKLNPSILGISVIEWSGHRLLRAYGNLPHPNILGGVLSVGLILLTSFYLTVREKLKFRGSCESVLLFIFAFLTMFLGLFFTFSRSAWLPLGLITIVGMVIFLICHLRHKLTRELRQRIFKVNLILLGCLILTVALFFAPLKVRFNPEESYMPQVIKSRSDYFQETKQLSEKYWWKGVGAGNYVKGVFNQITSTDQGFLYQPVHNVLALVFAETGIGGLILVLILIGYWFRELLIRIRGGLKSEREVGFFVVSLSLFTLFLANMLDHYLLTSMMGFYLLWLLMGMGFLLTGEK